MGLQSIPKNLKRVDWAVWDDRVRDCYAQGKRPAAKILARQIGIAQQSVRNRARKLGILVGITVVKYREWMETEKEIVAKYGHYSADTVQKHLRKAGFHRTENAIEIYRKRRLGTKDDLRMEKGVLTASRLAECLGLHQACINRWIKRGWLKAVKTGETATAPYLIKERDFVQFFCDYTAHVDISKMDKYWLADLLKPFKGRKKAGREGDDE